MLSYMHKESLSVTSIRSLLALGCVQLQKKISWKIVFQLTRKGLPISLPIENPCMDFRQHYL